jgi:hypothetical protein
MAYVLNFQALSVPAGQDLSNNQQQFVMLDSTGCAVLCDQTTQPIGVLENAPGIYMPASISYNGVTKVLCDSAISIGTFLRSDTTGTATAATSLDGTNISPYARAVALEATDASSATTLNQMIAVRLMA